MAFVNVPAREICCKIVYVGPGLSGKTKNVELIYERTAPSAKGKLLSLKTDTERTLFFDFLPIDLGSLGGFRTRIQLYTAPGQIYYAASRRLILRGADGVVFVADSQRARVEANAESMDDLRDGLADQGLTLDGVAFVVQYNKRDLDEIATVEELRGLLNQDGYPEIEAVAAKGIGVFETLKLISRSTLKRLELGRTRR
ncbi:MAG: gliding-motility protein MglA [Polyangiaceae bacterium]|nr:gliding-motility protein MglA [Polyangiaceae bacterium]